MSYDDLLRALRQHGCFPQVAARAGVSVVTVRNMARGWDVRLSTAMAVAQALGYVLVLAKGR